MIIVFTFVCWWAILTLSSILNFFAKWGILMAAQFFQMVLSCTELDFVWDNLLPLTFISSISSIRWNIKANSEKLLAIAKRVSVNFLNKKTKLKLWSSEPLHKWTNRRNYQRKTILEASFPNGLGHIICLNCFEWFQMVSSLHNKWLFLNSNCYLAVTYLMLNSFSKIDVEKWVDFEIFHKNCCPNSLFFGLKMFFE